MLETKFFMASLPGDLRRAEIVDQWCFMLLLDLWKNERVPCHVPKSMCCRG